MFENVTADPLFLFERVLLGFGSVWLKVMEGGRKGHLIFQVNIDRF